MTPDWTDMAAPGTAAGVGAGLIGAAAFATSGPMVKPLLIAGWSPGGAILLRLGLGALLLVVPTMLAVRHRPTLLLIHWRPVVAFGLAGVAGASTLFYLAVDRLPVAVALLVEYTGPLLLIAWSWLRGGRAPAPGVLAGAALAMGGLVLVLDVTGQIELDPRGLLFAGLAAVCNAAYFAIVAVPSELPPVALAGSGMLVGAVVVGLVDLAGVLPTRMVATDVALAGRQVSWVIPVLVVGVLPTAFAYGVSAVSVRLLGERVASFVALAEVLFAVLLAWVLIGEAPAVAQLAGGALVVAGMVLVRRAATPEPAVRTSAEPARPAGATEDLVDRGRHAASPVPDGQLTGTGAAAPAGADVLVG
jgi:drug/metabolite transporter (DMT)-like permease